MMIRLASCVTPGGTFQYGIHKPSYTVENQRQQSRLSLLGYGEDGREVDNSRNFPEHDVEVHNSDWIYEIPNPLPFRGRTYINKRWADRNGRDITGIHLPPPLAVSLSQLLREKEIDAGLITQLPRPLLLALATTSTDSADLIRLAEASCEFIKDGDAPSALRHVTLPNGTSQPLIKDHALFEAVANNPHLPDSYKITMVLLPGVQGGSEIVGEWIAENSSHVYEYLRRNSYIAGGHFAANMAEDAIRYSIDTLTREDMRGMRHLYYQRSYLRLLQDLGITPPENRQTLATSDLETLRTTIASNLEHLPSSPTTLWGWNFGFDYAPSGYRLHASHQQIHQQYAYIGDTIDCYQGGDQESCGSLPAYSCGDLVADWISSYKQTTGSDFFADYRQAIASNRRLDNHTDRDADLVVWQNDRAMLFVPKAQTSQWELQIMTLPANNDLLPGNIVECDSETRDGLDTCLYLGQKALAGLGARMVSSIEFPKRIAAETANNQALLYSLLPRLPESPGAFSEAQLRFINGHYPEDFAAACRKQLENFDLG